MVIFTSQKNSAIKFDEGMFEPLIRYDFKQYNIFKLTKLIVKSMKIPPRGTERTIKREKKRRCEYII